MKYALRFLLLYFLVSVALFSFYFDANKESHKKLVLTESGLKGTIYIQEIYHLAIDLVDLKNRHILRTPQESIETLKDDIALDISGIFMMQELLPQFKNDAFNQQLKQLNTIENDDELFYTFLGSTNHENYRIGDISKLLFEEDRDIYFLGTLLTHYMPEYLISILLSDHFIKEFYHTGKLSIEKKNLFVEQNKFVYLSSEELEEIIKRLKPTQANKRLLLTMHKIIDNLEKLSKERKSLSKWQRDEEELKRYLSISKEIISLSLDLNTQYSQTLILALEERKLSLEDVILTNKIIFLLTFLLITAISIYFYRVKRSSYLKEKEIKKINAELDQIALFSKSDTKGNITHISSALLKLSGFSRNELIGANHRIFKHPDNDPDIFTELWETITNKKIWSGALKNRRKDGSAYWVELTIVPELNKKGEITAYSAHRADITHIKSLVLEKKKTQEALAFKSKFLSNMSHEIRTPLNGIIGLIHVLLKTKLNEKQADILNKVELSSEILLGIINDILDISKIESGKMSIEKAPFNLQALVQAIESTMFVKASQKGIKLSTNYHNIDNFNFLGDSLRISQIVNNLLSNAIKFTTEGGVSIDIAMLDNGNVRFDIKDSGIGLKAEDIETLFEEFTQADMSTSRKYGGTGLGLSISKNLVNLMGGEIWVTSSFGGGSTFSFEIPLEVNTEVEDSFEYTKVNLLTLETEVNALTNFKILVAEDNKMNQMVLSMILESSQLDLDFALDGAIAVEKFNENHYDLILMDIQMPNLNGFEATEMIRLSDKEVPIIALSANVMQEDIQKALSLGMNGYLAKPIEVVKLYETLLKQLK